VTVAVSLGTTLLSDGAAIAVAAGLGKLVRDLWPVRRRPVGSLSLVTAGLVALGFALTDGGVQRNLAATVLGGLVAGWLIGLARQARSRLRRGGWSALAPRRKAPAVSHVYIWVDGVIAVALTAFIARQDFAAILGGTIGVGVYCSIASARLRRRSDRDPVALWLETRRPTPEWRPPPPGLEP